MRAKQNQNPQVVITFIKTNQNVTKVCKLLNSPNQLICLGGIEQEWQEAGKEKRQGSPKI